MLIGTVVGSAVATVKHEALEAGKLLVVRQTGADAKMAGEPFLAVDLVGAGEGQLVIVSRGSSARMATGDSSAPVDAAIVGILDSVWVEGTVAYGKE